MTEQFVMWNGERWGLYNDGYFRKSGRYLHREKWAKLRGPIPDGHHVHHKNHVRSDNRIDNLECLSKSSHMAHHAKGRKPSDGAKKKREAWWQANKVAIGRKISAAHASRVREVRQCEWCGADMSCFNTQKKICSKACHLNKRYHDGVDDEDRTCSWCSKQFRVNRHKKTLTCSRPCGTRLAWAKRRSLDD